MVIGVLMFAGAVSADQLPPRNFVFILCDNLGYGDIGCFGSNKHRTENVDRLAAEGMRLTSYYSTSGVCTPSRASLMTGCYPRRVGLDRTLPDGAVLRPVSPNGLHPDEITIAEVLQRSGYATACIGKWHLGDQLPFLPTRQGFDHYYGIPYRDDMTPGARTVWPELPLMRDESVIEAPADRHTLTQRYTREAVGFIEANKHRPFFLYLAHAMPGSTSTPFASGAFRGKSSNGPYGDSVEEIDWSTGKILEALRQWDLDRSTLVVWTSDNGAPRRQPPQGSNQPLGGWGYTTREGGMRVPCLVRWTNRIPAGTVCDEVTTAMDWLPTFAGLAGGKPPTDRIIDGHDIWPLLSGQPGATSPYDAFYYYHLDQLQAVRSGKWKLYLDPDSKRSDLTDESESGDLRLYNLESDLREATDIADRHPRIVERLSLLAEQARVDLGDMSREGAHRRPVGHVQDPRPQQLPR